MIRLGIDVERRPATAEDEPYLRALFAESRDDLALLPPAIREHLVDMQLAAQRAQYAASHPEATHQILVVDGHDVGRLVLAECHIVDITISRAHRRRGIAAAVVRQVIAANAPEPTTLNVWSQNLAARSLYDGLGFDVTTDGEGYLTMTHRSAS